MKRRDIMYCHQCGKEVGEAKYCPYCGTKLIYDGNEDMYTNSQYMNNVSSNDAPSTGFAILSFCFPIVGIILFIIWNKDYPQKAKSCLKGFIAGIVLNIVMGCCLMSSFISNTSNDYSDEIYYDMFTNRVVEIDP